MRFEVVACRMAILSRMSILDYEVDGINTTYENRLEYDSFNSLLHNMARSAASWPTVTGVWYRMRPDAIKDLERIIKYGQNCVNLFQNGPHSFIIHIQSLASSLELQVLKHRTK